MLASLARHARLPCLLAPALLVASLLTTRLFAGEQITVVADEASVIKLPERVATVVVGNPLIADVSPQAGGLVVVTGKGYGSTNLLALDRAGAVLMERSVVVQAPRDNVVVVYRGIDRNTYSCAPDCDRRATLGDAPAFFGPTLNQVVTRSTQALAVQGGR